MKEFESYRDIFASRLSSHLHDSYAKTATHYWERRSSKVLANDHKMCFQILLPFLPLVHWLKSMDNLKFEKSVQSYSHAMRNVYKKEIREFFSELKSMTIKEHKDQRLLCTFLFPLTQLYTQRKRQQKIFPRIREKRK